MWPYAKDKMRGWDFPCQLSTSHVTLQTSGQRSPDTISRLHASRLCTSDTVPHVRTPPFTPKAPRGRRPGRPAVTRGPRRCRRTRGAAINVRSCAGRLGYRAQTGTLSACRRTVPVTPTARRQGNHRHTWPSRCRRHGNGDVWI